MKNLKNNISYKFYANGKQFIEENEIYLHKNKETSIETAFFFLNANNYHQLDQNNYALQFKSGEDVLLILRLDPYNMLLFGAKSLCEFAANCLADYNLNFEHILGEQEVNLEFLNHYQKRKGGNILLEHAMQIMVLNQLSYFTKDEVFKCSEKDLDVLAECYSIFQKEIFQKDMSILEAKAMIQGNEHNFYAYKVEDKIVSIASKTREEQQICALSHVFTKTEY
ncbi:hypothetical protein HDR67_02515, partial [bacterium]|nr:hypothetical protein [bacterium]